MARMPDTAPTTAADERRTAPTVSRAAAADASVLIDDVTVTYAGRTTGDVDAVRHASLEIPSGSIVALLGPSGCGKTSLLRAIAGLERPRHGSISIGGRVVSGGHTWVQPEHRSVGMVFQDGALFPHLTVADNVAFGLRSSASKMSKSERTARVADMLDLVDLTELGDRLPGTLSGGQQQRVALARSLAPQPAVLLLDEPFSALDAALRVQVRADVADIVRDVGVTTVFVTHDQDEAFVLGDRVAVLRDGRIEQVGSPDELYRNPRTRWVAGFVGEANLVRGTVSADAAVAGTLLGDVPLSADHQPGAAVDVLVRPEQVELHHGDCAVVNTVEYYGHDVRYELGLNDGSILAARTKSGELHDRGAHLCVRHDGTRTEAWPVTDPDGDPASTLLTP